MRRKSRIRWVVSGAILAVFLSMSVDFAFAKVDPYSYKNRYLMPIYEKTFVTPSTMKQGVPERKELPKVAPRIPAISKDGDGNIIIRAPSATNFRKNNERFFADRFSYVFPSFSNFSTRIDVEGNTESLKNNQVHFKRDYDGNLTEMREFTGGSGMVTIKNEFGEITGFEEFGQGGRILRAYDEEHYLTASFGYNHRSLAWIVDELLHTKTICDRYGRAMYDIDHEGNKIAFYEYNGNNKLKWKIDLYGNKTIYDDKGRKALFTLDFEGNIVATFNYNDPRNGYRLTSIVDQYGNIVEYKKDRPQKMQDYQGNLLKEWLWQGTKLIMSKDLVTDSLLGLEANIVTWYKNGKPTHATADGVTIKNWIYIRGKTAGIWDGYNITLFDNNGLKWGKLFREDLSDINKVKAWVKAWVENNWI
jgi:hypothetical protein